MRLKKIILIMALIAIVLFGVILAVIVGAKNSSSNAKYKIVVTNFASYDFLRAIIGKNDDIELTFLLGPGKDSHSYDPTAQDLVKIQEADIFIYVRWRNGKLDRQSVEYIRYRENKNCLYS